MVVNIHPGSRVLPHETGANLSYDGVASTQQHMISTLEQNSNGGTFQAQPRPRVWTAADCAYLALKVIFFPVTLVYYIFSYLCSFIAFPLGVGATSKVDEAKRSELRALGGDEVAFNAEGGVKLEGMHFANPHAASGAKTVLICSGSHASYEKYTVPMVDALLRQGHHVMVFNYRGFGRSEGSASEEGFNLDAEAAYQYIQSTYGKTDDQMCVWGYSMGSAPATDLAANHDIKLVLDRYFSSMSDVAYDKGGSIAKGIFSLGGAHFDLKEKIKNVRGGIFLARGDQDTTMMPYHETELKKSLAAGRASFVTAHSGHIHSSGSSLWFHPQNGTNAAQRQQLQSFFQSSP